MPVAMNCSVVPSAMLGAAGVIAIETSVAEVTDTVPLPLTLPNVAVSAEAPPATAVTSPVEPATGLTVAAAGAELDQVTWVVRSCFEPSEKMPVAVRACEVPGASTRLLGLT